MIFHENRLLADDSHVISYLTFVKIAKDVAKFVVCCSVDWSFNPYRNGMVERMNVVSTTTKFTKLAKFVGQMCN